jgi:hypothetical protein
LVIAELNPQASGEKQHISPAIARPRDSSEDNSMETQVAKTYNQK